MVNVAFDIADIAVFYSINLMFGLKKWERLDTFIQPDCGKLFSMKNPVFKERAVRKGKCPTQFRGQSSRG